jgi:membrane dipeptidase
MKTLKSISILFVILFCLIACSYVNKTLTETDLKKNSVNLAQRIIIIDSHIDVPYRLNKKMEDISTRTEGGDFDYSRAKQGGLNVPFMAIYIPPIYEKEGGAKALADSLIDMVENFEKDWPDKFTMATSVADVKKKMDSDKIILAMGMENGSGIEGDLDNLKHFHDRGIRYITLVHSKNNNICDSSFDEEPKWNGLSPFGKKVVSEMNQLGIMIDISHVTDSTFYQVIKYSKAPVIASHSSCREFTPGWERNMSDDMIKLLADKGGVIQINFGSGFINKESSIIQETVMNHINNYIKSNNLKSNDKKAEEYKDKYWEENPIPYADISDLVANIDHVVKLVGIDYVGLGSDFDGLGDSLPVGIKDVSEYPNLIYELLKIGYSNEDIIKICSDNILRVWSDVEKLAVDLNS